MQPQSGPSSSTSIFSSFLRTSTGSKNSFSDQQLEDIARFIGASVESLKLFTNKEIGNKLVYAFENSDLSGQAPLTLANLKFYAPKTKVLSFPNNVTLVDCQVASGRIKFYTGNVTATSSGAIAYACGPTAIATAIGGGKAVAEIKGAKVYANDGESSAVADGIGTRAEASFGVAHASNGGTAIAKFLATAAAEGVNSVAIAEGDSCKAHANKYASAYAMGPDATAVAHESSTSYAMGENSLAIAQSTSTAYAYGKNSTARAVGPNAIAKKIDSTAKTEFGKGIIQTDGARSTISRGSIQDSSGNKWINDQDL